MGDIRSTAGRSGPHARGTSRPRRTIARFALAAAGPLVFLVLLEGGLRLAGYGYPTSFFVPMEGSRAYTTNPRFNWRFMPPAMARAPVAVSVPRTKPAGAFRIFVLGESAAHGTPDPSYGFVRMLDAMLRQRYPDARFEVVNAAVTAIDSHVVLPIARECARHEGDLFIVYMGNNEVIGPFGPLSRLSRFSFHRGLIRAGIWLTSLRTGQLLQSLAEAVHLRAAAGEWMGMEAYAGLRSPPDDPRRKRLYAHFRANLRDIIRAAAASGANVIVCTVGVNLRDSPPFASARRADAPEAVRGRWEALYADGEAFERSGRPAEALAKYAQAAEIDDCHAETQFRMARCCLALDRFDEARRRFALARDCDALQFRADSRINECIRAVAADESSRGVRLVDAERALEESELTLHRIPGRELFWEHVHLNCEGNYELAKALLPEVEAVLPAAIRRTASPAAAAPSLAECERRLAYTAVDRQRIAESMLEMMSRPPFTEQMDHAQATGEMARAAQRFVVDEEATRESIRGYEAALEESPRDDMLHRNFAALLADAGRLTEAEEHLKAGNASVTQGGDGVATEDRRCGARKGWRQEVSVPNSSR